MKKNVPKRWARKKDYAYLTYSSNSWISLPRSIEPDDLKRLLKKRFTPRDKCLILILLRTGMRISELLALKVKDINFKQRIIIIHESAKTGVGRIVYMSDDTHKALKNAPFLSGEMGKAGTDCSDCHGSGHKSATDVANVQLPTEKTCQKCHEEKHDQYMAGKHAAATRLGCGTKPVEKRPVMVPLVIPAIHGINFPKKRQTGRKRVVPATWGLIIRSGRCGPVPSTA